MDERYELSDQIGTGGMSVVWRAHDAVLGRDVAVKVLSAELASDPALLDRIRLEARSAAGLRHPNIVEVYDYGEATDGAGPPRPYVVMELVDGPTLSQLLKRGPLPWHTAVHISAQVAAALAAAHGRGVVHRDVKPGNVMVTGAGVKLVDFGISATVGEADEADGTVLGTPAYLAPERLDGGPVRPATDVYALGLLLYRALAGQLPWAASTVTQMVTAHLYREPAELPAVAGLPPEVVELCRRCLRKLPEARPSAAEAARILAEVAGLTALTLPTADPADDSATAAVAAVGGPAVHRPTVTRRRSLVAAAAAASLALVASIVWWPTDDRTLARASPATAGTPGTATGCTVTYTVRSTGPGRLATAVSLVNTGAAALADWHLTFALPAGQRLTRGWTGRWEQDGQTTHLRGTGLPAGGTAETGFDASYEGTATFPTRFEVNGVSCSPLLSAATPTTPAVATTAAPNAAPTVAPANPAAGAVPGPAKAPVTTAKKPKTKAPKTAKPPGGSDDDEDGGDDEESDDEE